MVVHFHITILKLSYYALHILEKWYYFARYSICAVSPRIIDGQSQLWTPPVGETLPFLRALLDSQKQHLAVNVPQEIPFSGGWLGWLGYDLAWEIEHLS